MDYKKLLKKYMRFVLEFEGSTFVSNTYSPMSDVEFTEEELAILEDFDENIYE